MPIFLKFCYRYKTVILLVRRTGIPLVNIIKVLPHAVINDIRRKYPDIICRQPWIWALQRDVYIDMHQQ